MTVQIEKTGAYLTRLTITLPRVEVDRAYDAAQRRVAQKAQLPGFRRGKIPRLVLERRFGAQIQEETRDALIQASLFNAMDTHNVEAVGQPTLQLNTLTRGADFTYTVAVEVRPEVTLVQYKGLHCAPIQVDVADTDVDADIASMRKEAAQTVPVTDRKIAEVGDFVLLEYVGSIDGVSFPGGASDNVLVELGAKDYIPGFAEGIIGAEVPGQRDVPVQFPADYGMDALAGKTAVFAMKFKELKARELPQLDDAFAQDMGADSLVLLRTTVRDRLMQQRSEEAKTAQRQQIMQALVAANPIELPPSMVDNQVEGLVAAARDRLQRMTGQKTALDSQTIAELRGSSRADAQFQVHAGLLHLAVGKAENMVVTDSELDAEIEKIITNAGDRAHEARSAYTDDDRRDRLRFSLLEERVMAFVLAAATPT